MTPPMVNGGSNGVSERINSKNPEIQIPMTPMILPKIEKTRSDPLEKAPYIYNSPSNIKTKSTGLKKAKVLFDFEAGDENELTVLSNEVKTIFQL
jgi:hypothetical protein